MAQPTTEGDGIFDFKGFHQLFEADPLRAIADNGEPGQIVPQKRGRSAQSKIAGFPSNQAADKNQLEFGAGLRPARLGDAQGASNTILREKNSLSLCPAN